MGARAGEEIRGTAQRHWAPVSCGAPCPPFPALTPTLYPRPGLHFHFCPQQLLPSLFLSVPSVSIYVSLCTDLNIWESLQTVQKSPLMATIHMEPTMFQKVHRSHFYYFHLHSNPVIERILYVHQMTFLLALGTTFPSLPCH